MKLIDVTCSYSDDPDFIPRTPDQLSSCIPVVDFHHRMWDPHCSERFQTLALFLGPTRKEKRGFAALEHYEFGAAGNPQVGEHNEIN